MQNKELNKFLLLPVPLEDCIAAGIRENCVLQTYTENGRVIISTIAEEDFVCSGDCVNCSIAETDCEGDCTDCPCSDKSDDYKVKDYE
mgnify:CR=1 FL=1